MYPSAPSPTQYSPLSALETTATGIPPACLTSWIAWLPRPPEPPQTRTMSSFCTVLPAQPKSIRWAVVPTSVDAAAASHVRWSAFGRHLVLLRDRELPERAEVAIVVVAPDPGRGGDHRILARDDPRVVVVPPAGVHDDLVADRDALDALADGVDDARRVTAAEVEVVRVAAALPLRDHVDRECLGRPTRC